MAAITATTDKRGATGGATVPAARHRQLAGGPKVATVLRTTRRGRTSD